MSKTHKELQQEFTQEEVAETKSFNTRDNINPNHYSDMKIGPNFYITVNNLEWEVGNIVKYVSRYKNKNGIEDLRKAKKYLELLCERVYGEEL